MNWTDYKQICEAADSFSRWALRETLNFVTDSTVRQQLEAVLATNPVVKPADHKGDADTDFFKLSLNRSTIAAVLQSLVAATGQETGKRQRQLQHLSVIWQEYALLLDGSVTE